MYKTVKTSLINGGQVVRVLLRRFGPDQVCQVVQETEDVFLARLRMAGWFRPPCWTAGR